ncbi:MAG: lysophospholipid acyltransferase family protein [Burkholderiaceae bacterium]
MRLLRASGRAARVLAHMVGGLGTIMFRFPSLKQAQRDLQVQAWATEMLARLGVRMVVYGTPPVAGPVLLVSNHISWLDILVLHAARHCRFVSKSDVRQWPLIGRLATGAGTLYVERRSRRDAMRVVHVMAQALRDGEILAIFPEGTTGDGGVLLPFHANLLQAAISTNVPIQPIALRFVDALGQVTQAASYMGDESLAGSLWRTLCTPGVVAHVRFGTAQWAQGRDRRGWALDLWCEVDRLRKS